MHNCRADASGELEGLEACAVAEDEAEIEGKTVVAVGWDGQARGILVVTDAVKPTSDAAIATLKGLGLTPVLLISDNEAVAKRIAAEVGIERVLAEVLPKDKIDVVTRLQRNGKVVAMVGDGINDAHALAQADPGLCQGVDTGSNVVIEARGITLVHGDLRAAVDAIRLSRRTLGTIKTNLFLGLCLQRRRHSDRGTRHAQPHARSPSDGVLQRLRRRQQPSPARVPQRRQAVTPRHRSRHH